MKRTSEKSFGTKVGDLKQMLRAKFHDQKPIPARLVAILLKITLRYRTFDFEGQ